MYDDLYCKTTFGTVKAVPRLKQYHAVREEYLFENASNVTKLNMYNFSTTN